MVQDQSNEVAPRRFFVPNPPRSYVSLSSAQVSTSATNAWRFASAISHPIEIERIRDASLTVEMERSPNQSAAVRRVSYQLKIAAPVPTAPAAGWKAWS